MYIYVQKPYTKAQLCLLSKTEQKFIIAGLLFPILFIFRKEHLYFGSPENISV